MAWKEKLTVGQGYDRQQCGRLAFVNAELLHRARLVKGDISSELMWIGVKLARLES